MPGVPAGKCNLYDHGVGVALVARMPGSKPGRIIDDFVCLPDLAPTFMEVESVKPPPGLYGRSLLPILKSKQSGQIDSTRNWVVTGRERHVAAAREGNLPYPMRALRTADFVYIRNFAADRWPMGSPKEITDTASPVFTALQNNTFTAYADMDASPTKAWLVMHRNEPLWRWHYEFAFGKRPSEELYDLHQDPDQVRNLASDPAYAAKKQELAQRLLRILTDAGDPRVIDNAFDRPPYTDLETAAKNTQKKAAAKKTIPQTKNMP
jgi:uncharacterized sulfatase